MRPPWDADSGSNKQENQPLAGHESDGDCVRPTCLLARHWARAARGNDKILLMSPEATADVLNDRGRAADPTDVGRHRDPGVGHIRPRASGGRVDLMNDCSSEIIPKGKEHTEAAFP